MDERLAIEALREVKKMLDKHGVTYWLDAGTLLGAVRDGKLIPWDNDIDLGTWYKDIDKIINVVENLRNKGFLVYFHLNFISLCYKERDITIDINTYHIDDGFAVWERFVNSSCMKLADAITYLFGILLNPIPIGDIPYPVYKPMPHPLREILTKIAQMISYPVRQRLMHILERLAIKLGCRIIQVRIPLQYFTSLFTIKFYGMKFKAPSPIEEYLIFRYGKDWRTPKKNYVYYEEDGAIV